MDRAGEGGPFEFFLVNVVTLFHLTLSDSPDFALALLRMGAWV
jgi:hypothetical protein